MVKFVKYVTRQPSSWNNSRRAHLIVPIVNKKYDEHFIHCWGRLLEMKDFGVFLPLVAMDEKLPKGL